MLCLILTFFLVSGLCLIFGCEFLSLLLIFVYVGSISILFLFAAMFLDLWAFRLCDVNLASTFFCAVLQGNLLPLYCNWFCNWFTYSVSSLIWAVNGSSLNQCLQHYHFQWIDLYSAKSITMNYAMNSNISLWKNREAHANINADSNISTLYALDEIGIVDWEFDYPLKEAHVFDSTCHADILPLRQWEMRCCYNYFAKCYSLFDQRTSHMLYDKPAHASLMLNSKA